MKREREFEEFSSMVKSFCSINKLKLLAIIYKEPGLIGVDLVNRIYAESTTTYNHLKSLKKHKLIIAVREGRPVKYYFNHKIAKDFLEGFYHLMEKIPGSDKDGTKIEPETIERLEFDFDERGRDQCI